MKHLNVVLLAGTVVVPKDSTGLTLQRFGEDTCKLVLRIRNVKGKKSENDQYAPADFFTVSVWGKTAEWAAGNLNHGDLVVVRAHLSPNNYKDKNGRDVYGLDIVADELERYVMAAGSLAETQQGQSESSETQAKQSYQQAAPEQSYLEPPVQQTARSSRGSMRTGSGAARGRRSSAGAGGYMSSGSGYEV